MKIVKLQIFLVSIAFALLVPVIGTSTSAQAAQFPSSAAQGPVQAVVKGGELSLLVGTPSSAVSTPLNNSMQKVSYTVPVTVIDATGSGDGWAVRLATDSETSSQSAGSPFVTSIVTSCTVDFSCSLPINTVSYDSPIVLGADSLSIFTATHNTGMGTVMLNVNVSVILPVNVSLNNYSGNLAFALSSDQAW